MYAESTIRKFAIDIVKDVGKILQNNFKRQTKISFKEDLSLISEIDLTVEKKIISSIKKKFPSHNILSEENGGEIKQEYTWIIDPLDGTTNYIMGIPFFCISLALLFQNNPHQKLSCLLNY